MLRITRRIVPAAILLGLLLAVGPAWAQLRDEAELVKDPATLDRINRAVNDIRQRFRVDLLIETKRSVSPGDVDKVRAMNDEIRQQYFNDLAKRRAQEKNIHGIYIFINKSPKGLSIIKDNKTLEAFSEVNVRKLRDIMFTQFDKKEFGKGLLQGVDYINSQFTANPPRKQGVAAAPPGKPGRNAGENWAGIICIALVGFAVVWLVLGLIRAMTAPRGYGAGGYGGGGYGGGGGGFMSGLLGGLFGAMAGNWLYHNMFGGGGSSWGSQAHAGDSGPSPSGGNDTDYSATGGSWDEGGRDAGGGDAGGGDAGGGDWGGGGGGDFGGGGGGDW